MTSTRYINFTILTICFSALFAGCATKSKHYSSSVVQYLYPNHKNVIETPAIPKLTLPLRVGIAFVPESSNYYGNKTLTERNKMVLMKSVSDHFKKYDFIKSIDLIPSAYLTPEGSFTNLKQIQTMYGIDVITLLSFDQSQFTDEGLATITYWTLVGAYVVPGEKNDTHTMLDAAVYDIKSQKMLFRAPGTSRIKSNATLVNLAEQHRLDAENGFVLASRELVSNLDLQLQLFREKVKEESEDYQIEHSASYTGAGSMDSSLLGLMGLLLGGYWVWSRKYLPA